jgi:hypothetical protein
LIAAIGEQLFQERGHPEQGRDNAHAAVTVLNIGRMDDDVKQQAQRIDRDMAFLAADFLARIIAPRIDVGPPWIFPLPADAEPERLSGEPQPQGDGAGENASRPVAWKTRTAASAAKRARMRKDGS